MTENWSDLDERLSSFEPPDFGLAGAVVNLVTVTDFQIRLVFAFGDVSNRPKVT